MPTLRGITVQVITEPGEPLQEWGVQQFPTSNSVSCYIKSSAGVRFEIALRPQIPYHPGFYKDFECQDRPGRSGHHRSGDRHLISAPFVNRSSGERTENVPDFHFIASLYLDGRSKPERRTIIYLDPDASEFRQPDGKAHLRTRWVEALDGSLREHSWYFSEVKMETLFDQLFLDKSTSHASDQMSTINDDDGELAAALNAMGMNTERDNAREENLRVGQIVVEVQRVVLGARWENRRFKPKHREGQDEDVEIGSAGVDKLSHTVTIGKGTLISERVPVVSYSLYDEREGPFARFQSFYRGEEKLRQFNFNGFPPRQGSQARPLAPLPQRGRKMFNFDFIAPLALTNASKLIPSTPTITTFEESLQQLQESASGSSNNDRALTGVNGDEESVSQGLEGRSRITGSAGTAFGDENCHPEHYESLRHTYRQPSRIIDYDIDDEQELRTDSAHNILSPLEERAFTLDEANTVRQPTFGDSTGMLKQRRNGFAHSKDSQLSGVQLGKRVRSSSSLGVDDLGPAGKSRKNTTEPHGSGHYRDGWQPPSIMITRAEENRRI